jgi:LPXTG-motif cell wall-anchored protein
VVQPVSSTPSGNLAETGGNGTQTVAFAGGGAALLVAGGAAVYFTRRRNRTTS